MERIVIETTEEIKDSLKTLAFNRNTTMKALIDEAIELVLRKYTKKETVK